MKVFLSGPISGLEREVYVANFSKAFDLFKGYQLEPINPTYITAHLPNGTPWKEYMTVCIQNLILCDAIYMLDGWQESKGAKLEHDIAAALGMILMYENPFKK